MDRKRVIRVAALMIVGLVLAPDSVVAAGFRLPQPSAGYSNSVGAGVSYGFKLDENAWLWGVSTDYTRVLSGKWLVNGSLAFDREKERRQGPDKETDTFSLAIAVGYSLTQRLVVGASVGHGIVSKETPNRNWKWTKLGDDLSTGVVASYTIWQKGRHDISPSPSCEYNISDKKWSMTFDLGWSYSF